MRCLLRWKRWFETSCLTLCCGLGFGSNLAAREPAKQSPETPQSQDLRPGLRMHLEDGTRNSVTYVPTPHFYLRADESLHPEIAPAFRAEWHGFLTVLEPGRYHFSCDGATLRIDGKIASTSEGIELASGRHPLRLNLERRPGPASLQLRWRSAHFVEEPVPVSHFHTRVEDQAGNATNGTSTADDLWRRGRAHVETYGCLHCHTTDSPNLSAHRAPDLRRAARLRPAWLLAWLENPVSLHAKATMPALLTSEETRDVAAFLHSQTLRTEQDESTTASPDRARFDREAPASEHQRRKGRELFETLGCAACHSQAEPFRARVAPKFRRGELRRYLLDPAHLHAEGSMPSMMLNEDEATFLAAFLTTSTRTAPRDALNAADAAAAKLIARADAERGRALVEERGCLQCHSANGLRSRAETAPQLSALEPTRGCLATAAGSTPTGIPSYSITGATLRELHAFLERHRRLPREHAAPLAVTRRRLNSLRCTACHSLAGRQPTETLVDPVPTLDGVGAKLQTDWLAQVLGGKHRVRSHLLVRMPHYAPALTDSLATGLRALSGLPPDERSTDTLADDASLQRRGVELLGNNPKKKGLSCVGCHDVGEHRPLADERGPQFFTTARRLRFEWFRRWLLNPGRLSPGTSMPSYFTDTPVSKADETIRALWAALSLRDAMPLPDGAGATLLNVGLEGLPAPGHEAVVVRFPLPESSAASIAVGLPRQRKIEPISYCFDAATCTLRYAWQGGFLDLRQSLGKRQELPELLGAVFFKTKEFPIRLGDEQRLPRVRFKGYRLVDGLPEFRYFADGIECRQRMVPRRRRAGFVQEFTLHDVTEPCWFVLPPQEDVRIESTLGEFDDGRLRLPLGERVRFDVDILLERENR